MKRGSRATLCVGSNHADRREAVERGMEFLRGLLPEEFEASPIYETPPVSGVGRRYMNCVVRGLTTLDAASLNTRLKEYEVACGRTAEAREAGRVPIDIDIVIWDGVVLRPRDFSHSFFQLGYSSLVPGGGRDE